MAVIGGQNSNVIGSDNTNLILKGKAIRVQWGNRFIDLIKDGKINVEYQDSIKIITDPDNENGFYIDPETQEIWVCLEGQKVNLAGNSYLSFMVEQQLTAEQKYRTLSNAGFYYKTLEEVQDIQGGIIYVEDKKKLYIVQSGQLQEFSFSSSTSQDEFTIGDLKIYKKDGDMTIASPSLIFSINNIPYIIMRGDIQINKDIVTSKDITIQSEEATSYQGYRLYMLNGLSTLEVDTIIEREKYEDNAVIYSQYNNLITECYIDNETRDVVCHLLFNNQFKKGDNVYVLVRYTNVLTVEQKDNVVTIKTESPVTSEVRLKLYVNNFEVIRSIEPGSTETILVWNEDITSFRFEIDKCPDNVSLVDTNKKNLFIYSVIDSTEETITINGGLLDFTNCRVFKEPVIKIQQDTMEVIWEDESVIRIGTLVEYLQEKNPITGEPVLKEHLFPGIKSKCYDGYAREFFFKESYPEYVEDFSYPTEYIEDVDENGEIIEEGVEESLKKKYDQVVPNIDWVKKLIRSYLPIGTIIMYNGESEIPEDWTICDGSHGSPNLVGKFIKASADEVGETIVNENNEITLTSDNIPHHTHQYIINSTSSTGEISSSDVTGTISQETSTGQLNGKYNDFYSNIFSQTQQKSIEIINIPKNSDGSIKDETIQKWGTTKITYDAGEYNYAGYLEMNPHSHTFNIEPHSHMLTMNNHTHTISEQEQEWKNTPIKVEPNYYSLIFIMKWK